MTRRDAVRGLALFLAQSPLWSAQQAEGGDAAPSLEDMINVFDFDPVCKAKTPKAAYEYVSGGGWDEFTLRRNREAFGNITFRPRFLREVDQLDLSFTLFGKKLPMPIFVAPTGSHAVVHAEGELATARAAGAAGALMVISSSSSFPVEKIAAAATGPLWFQLYTASDMAGTRERVQKALDAGCEAICFTVDAPYAAPRERDVRNRLQRAGTQPPARRRRAEAPPERPYGLEPRLTAFLNWSFVDELRGWAKTPLLIKGILTPEDALLAAEHGADGVVVSNHGGRYLDGDPATIEVLPEIVDAVGAKIPVLVDSGFRRGTDILKALAIGAKAVLVGRAPLWGLGAFGEPGAKRVLEILRKELAWAMALAGRPNIGSIDQSLIRIER
jgi:isopentenyl diphosphate isomerase/L-lactate dehydrogenase-like FMN-dependent dehydrogenase